MKLGDWLKSNIGDGRDVIESGIDGANSAWKHAIDDEMVASTVADVALNSWKPAAIGLCIGAISGFLAGEKKSARSVVVGGLLGGAVGLSGGMAWQTRSLIGSMASAAVKNMNSVRDEHWLARNPVAYG